MHSRLQKSLGDKQNPSLEKGTATAKVIGL